MNRLKFIFGWLTANPQIAGVIGLVIFIFIILLFVLGGIDSCRTRWTENKKADLNTNIKTAEIEANILTNQKVNINGEVKNANKISNNALVDFNNSVNRDSNTFSGNATDKFCQRFCLDSSCVEWRKTHVCRD